MKADSLNPLSHHFEEALLTRLILDINKLVADLGHHVDRSLVADDRVAVLVDPVEDREAEAEQGDIGVAAGKLAVGVADHGIDRIGHDEAAHVPEVLAHVDLAPFAVHGGVEQRLNLFLHLLAPLAAEDMVRDGAHLQQEGDVTDQLVGIAVEGKLLAVHVLVRIGHGVHRPATLVLDAFRHRLAGEFGDLLDKLVGLGNTERHRDGGMLAGVVVLQPGKGLGGRIGTEAEGRLAVDGIRGIIQLRAAGIGVVGAVAGGVEDIGDVAEDRHGDAELGEEPLVFTVVAGVGIKAGDQVDLAGAAAFHLLPFGQGMEDGIEHGVVAVDMGAVEAGGIGKGHRHTFRDDPLVAGILEEGDQVVTDDLRHAGGKDGDHFRLVDGNGVFQPLVEVVLAAEHRAVLGHGVGHRRRRLAEMAVKGGAVVGGAPLGTMDKGE